MINIIALIERQLAELGRGDSPTDTSTRFDEALRVFVPYGRALLAQPAPSPTGGRALSDEDLDAPTENREEHYARLLKLSRQCSSEEWEADAGKARFSIPPLRRAS